MTLTETFIAKAPPLRVDDHGVVRIGKTRVTLNTIISYYNQGMTAEDLASAFDTVGLSSMHAVISYYLENRAIVDAYLADCEREAEEIRKKIEATQRPSPTREMLLERQRKRVGRGKFSWQTRISTGIFCMPCHNVFRPARLSEFRTSGSWKRRIPSFFSGQPITIAYS